MGKLEKGLTHLEAFVYGAGIIFLVTAITTDLPARTMAEFNLLTSAERKVVALVYIPIIVSLIFFFIVAVVLTRLKKRSISDQKYCLIKFAAEVVVLIILVPTNIVSELIGFWTIANRVSTEAEMVPLAHVAMWVTTFLFLLCSIDAFWDLWKAVDDTERDEEWVYDYLLNNQRD